MIEGVRVPALCLSGIYHCVTFIGYTARQAIRHIMFKSIGFVIALAFTAHLFAGAFAAFEAASIATFDTVKTAAQVSELRLLELSR